MSEHSSNGIIPEISGELLIKIFIHKAEEEALGIDQKATERYRRDNQIPDSDGFAMIMPRENMQVYQRLYWNNYLYILYNSHLERKHKL